MPENEIPPATRVDIYCPSNSGIYINKSCFLLAVISRYYIGEGEGGFKAELKFFRRYDIQRFTLYDIVSAFLIREAYIIPEGDMISYAESIYHSHQRISLQKTRRSESFAWSECS